MQDRALWANVEGTTDGVRRCEHDYVSPPLLPSVLNGPLVISIPLDERAVVDAVTGKVYPGPTTQPIA